MSVPYNDGKQWIYAIQAGEDGPVKIGITTDLRRRLKSLQASHYVELNLVVAWRDDPEVEKLLHLANDCLCIRGEWFEPHPLLLEELRREGERAKEATWQS